MLKIFIAAVLSFCTATAGAQSITSRSLAAPALRDIGFVSQDYVLDGSTNTEFSVAPLTVSNQGFGTRKLSVRLPTPAIVNRLPFPVDVGNPEQQATILAEAEAWVGREYEPLRTRIAQWMRSRGLSQSYYSFNQEVMVSTPTGPRKRQLHSLLPSTRLAALFTEYRGS